MTRLEHCERLAFLREERVKMEQFFSAIEGLSSREMRELIGIIEMLKRMRKREEEME